MNISRVEKVGSIFTRVTGLMRSGVIKWEDRPLWYDVYAAHPPVLEPRWDRDPPINRQIRQIIYPEDKVRAHFYRTFGSVGTISLTNPTTKSAAENFIDKFFEMHKLDPQMSEDELINAATQSFTENIYEPKSTSPISPPENEDTNA